MWHLTLTATHRNKIPSFPDVCILRNDFHDIMTRVSFTFSVMCEMTLKQL